MMSKATFGQIRPPDGLALAVLFVNATLAASAFIAIEIALGDLGPICIAALRCAVAALFMTMVRFCFGVRLAGGHSSSGSVVSTATRERAGAGSRAVEVGMGQPWWTWLGLGGFAFAIPFAAIAWAETHLQVGHVALLCISGPVWGAAIGAIATTDERLTPRRAVGMSIAALGVVAQVVIAGTGSGSMPRWPAGAIVLSTLCYALAGHLVRRSRYPTWTLTMGGLWAATFMLLIFVDIPESIERLRAAEMTTLVAIVYLGLVATAVTSVVRYRQVVAHGYAFVSFTGYLVPMIGPVLAIVVLGEALSPGPAVGTIVVLVGLALARDAR